MYKRHCFFVFGQHIHFLCGLATESLIGDRYAKQCHKLGIPGFTMLHYSNLYKAPGTVSLNVVATFELLTHPNKSLITWINTAHNLARFLNLSILGLP